MRTVLYWVIMQQVAVISDVLGKAIFRGQDSWPMILTFEDWTDSLSQNVGKKLLLLAAQ